MESPPPPNARAAPPVRPAQKKPSGPRPSILAFVALVVLSSGRGGLATGAPASPVARAVAPQIAAAPPAEPGARRRPASAAAAAISGQHAPSPIEWKYPVWAKGCARYAGVEERLSCLEFVVSDWPRFSRYAAANSAVGPARKGEKRVVFMGDSITDGWSRAESGGFFPGKPYLNRGIGGQTTGQMLERFRADVLALGPRVVVILAGTNDIAGNSGVATRDTITGNLASMAELAKAHGVRVVLASVLPVSDDKRMADGKPILRTLERPLESIRAINDAMRAYAARYGHVYLDYGAAMSDGSGLLRPELSEDGLHPNAAGYAIMAPLAERAIAKAMRR